MDDSGRDEEVEDDSEDEEEDAVEMVTKEAGAERCRGGNSRRPLRERKISVPALSTSRSSRQHATTIKALAANRVQWPGKTVCHCSAPARRHMRVEKERGEEEDRPEREDETGGILSIIEGSGAGEVRETAEKRPSDDGGSRQSKCLCIGAGSIQYRGRDGC